MIKLFEDFNEIHTICKKYDIRNYVINIDGSIDVDGGVHLGGMELSKLPLKFNKVYGSFFANDNKLTTLDGSPSYVSEYFYCDHNKLTSLKGAPKEVAMDFFCDNNPLPQCILNNPFGMQYIIANQDDYAIWNSDGSFNQIRFDIMMTEKNL